METPTSQYVLYTDTSSRNLLSILPGHKIANLTLVTSSPYESRANLYLREHKKVKAENDRMLTLAIF